MSKTQFDNDGDNKKFNISIPETYDGSPIEIKFLEGDAPVTFEYEKKKFTATIAMSSIAEYIFKRPIAATMLLNPNVITFSLNPDKPFLNYHENPNDHLATELYSTLTINPDLLAFNINKDTLFSQDELKKLIVKMAHCFAPGIPEQLRKQLLNFEIKFEQTIQSANDKQGNTKDLVESAIKMVSGSIPSEIKISLPLYKSQQKVELTLLVEIDKLPSGNKPGFAFYCLELQPIMREAAEKIVITEVLKFKGTHMCLEIE